MGAFKLLGERQIKGEFWRSYATGETRSWSPIVANMYTSDQAIETFRWLGPVPAMREWIVQRQKKQLAVYQLTLTNGKYEVTLEVDIDDANRDKTGHIMARISEMGLAAANLPQKLLSATIQTPGNSYDGVAFFGDHSSGSGTRINNALTDTTIADPLAPTAAEMSRNIMQAISTMHAATSVDGEPVNDGAMEFAVMVPSLYQGPLAGALADAYTGSSSSNTLLSFANGAAGRRISIVPIVNPRLVVPTSTGVFYVFRTDTPTKPFIWQDEISEGGTPTKFESLVEGSETTFFSDKRVYGVKRKGVSAPGEHAMAVKVTVS